MGHFINARHEMAASIVDLEDGYFRALHEVIVETNRALRDVSHINAHSVSQVVTVMSSWQEVVQTAASHMEGVDTTIYLVHREDVQKATREYMAAVVKAREECDAAHTVEEGGPETSPEGRQLRRPRSPSSACHPKSRPHPVREGHRCLPVQHQEDPPEAQGPLISNALSTAFQFHMSVWRMIGEECIRPVWAKHSDWCGLAGIVQAIVETFPKNCALMFPLPPPPSVALFSTTFRLQSSDDDDDDDADNYSAGSSFCRFDSSLLAPAHGDLSRTGHSYTSTPLLRRGAFCLSTDPKGATQ